MWPADARLLTCSPSQKCKTPDKPCLSFSSLPLETYMLVAPPVTTTVTFVATLNPILWCLQSSGLHKCGSDADSTGDLRGLLFPLSQTKALFSAFPQGARSVLWNSLLHPSPLWLCEVFRSRKLPCRSQLNSSTNDGNRSISLI